MKNENNLSVIPSAEEIIRNPMQYNTTQIMPVLDAISGYANQLYSKKKQLEQLMLSKMKEIKASEAVFTDVSGRQTTYRAKPGKFDAVKDADTIYKEAGFDPLEIGKYKYEASWAAAKALQKQGGAKAEVIGRIFNQSESTLEIKR